MSIPSYREFTDYDYRNYGIGDFKNGLRPLIYTYSTKYGEPDVVVDVVLTPTPVKAHPDLNDPASITVSYYGGDNVSHQFDCWISRPMDIGDAIGEYKRLIGDVSSISSSLSTGNIRSLERVSDRHNLMRIVTDE